MAEPPIVDAMPDSSPVDEISISSVTPAPTDAEVVAIIAGVEALWPKPVVAVDTAPRRSTAWRFSGRWWAKPVSARRDRPYR